MIVGKGSVTRGFTTGDRAIVGPRAVMKVKKDQILQELFVLPLMAVSEEMCIVYMFNENKRCRLFGIEVRGMVVKVKTNKLYDWRVVNIKYVRNSMHVKSA